jgi:MFS family permease
MEQPEVTPRKLAIAAVCLLGVTFVPYVEAIIGPMMMLPMIEEFGWTRTQYSFAPTFMLVIGAASGLVFGRMADRSGPRSILVIGAVCGGGTMLLLSQQSAELWRLYLAYALLGAFGSTGLGYTKIMGTLFTRHRGKALAFFGAETTVAMATLPLLTNHLNVHYGWRSTYLVYGLIMFAIAPVLYLMLRGAGLNGPMTATTPGVGAPGAATSPAPVIDGLTPPQFRRDRTFWLVLLAAVLVGGLDAGLRIHIIAAITDKGFDRSTAAGVFSAATFVGLTGTVAVGLAMDYSRTARILSGFAVTAALGCLLFAIASVAFGGLALLVTGLAIQRSAIMAMPPGTNYAITRFVGMRSFGEAFALFVLVQGVAMGVTPPLFGMIYDRTGSYAAVYWIVGAGALAAAMIYLSLGPYRYGGNAAKVPKQRP